MDKNITLDFGALYETVARQLSVIGKRSTSEDGKLLFQDITIGTRERDIMSDFFTNAFVDLTSQLSPFITAAQGRYTEDAVNLFITFWTNQQPSAFISQITANGQLLYNYDTGNLYSSSITYPWTMAYPETDDLFVMDGDYYLWEAGGLVALTPEEEEELTPEQKAAATVITYQGDPETITAHEADVYIYYEDEQLLLKSYRLAVFTQETIPANAVFIDPTGRAFVRDGNALIQVFMGIDSYMDITLTVPNNWNEALTLPLETSLKNYSVAYAIHSWFVVTAPTLAEKYLADAQRQLAALRALIHEKKEPATPTQTYGDVGGTVTSN